MRTKFTRWTPDMPEPEPDTIVSVDALDCSWRLPWKTVRDDALSGLAAVYLEEQILMPRNPSNPPADETVTVRLPYGTAAKVRAATGQPFSRVVRWMVNALLTKHASEGGGNKLAEGHEAVAAVVNETSSGA